eukprot:m.13133 g.13133  ORF g.13133 m.13133 type:complete len:785 (-) comp10045_c0_seq1:303-2657(-)
MPPSADSPGLKRKNVAVSGASVGILADALITQLHLSDDPENISSVTLPASALHKDTRMQPVADGRYGQVSTTHLPAQAGNVPSLFVKSISELLTGDQKATASKEMQLEALALRRLNCEYILSAIGIVPEGDSMQPQHLLLTMYKHGNMRDFLQAVALSENFSDSSLPGAFRVGMAVDGARGLEYLHSQNIVLKDVGSRSFLVGENYHVVVGDLGLPSRFGTEDYWTRNPKEGAAVPVRWLPPEVVAIVAKDPVAWVLPAPGTPIRRVLCEASDVWSFGVTMWEIGSFAELPYLKYGTQKVITSLKKGVALPLGEKANFPAQLMDPIRWCMSTTTTDRPTFTDLISHLVLLHESLLKENPKQAIQGRELPSVINSVQPMRSDDPSHQYESVNYAALNSTSLSLADVPSKKKKWRSLAKSPKTTPKLKKKGLKASKGEATRAECPSPKSPRVGAPPSPKPPPRFDPTSGGSSAASTPSTSLIEGTNVNAHSFVNDDILDALVATLDASNANAFTDTVVKSIPRSMSSDPDSAVSSPGVPDGIRSASDSLLSGNASPTVFSPSADTDAALLQSISGAYTKTIDAAEKAAGPGLMQVANSTTEAKRRSALGPPPGYNAAPTYEEPVANNPDYMSAANAMADRQTTDGDGDGQYGVVLTADGRVVDMSTVAAQGDGNNYNPYAVGSVGPPVEDNYTTVTNASVNQQALNEARSKNEKHTAEIKARRKQAGSNTSSLLSDLVLPKDPLAEEDAYTQVVNDQVNESALEIARGLHELKKEHRQASSHLSVS